MITKNLDLHAADTIRILAAAMVEKAKSGHPGGAMGGADFIHVLFSEYLNFNPDDGNWPFRDRFFLDPGHMSPMLYAQLALCNKFTMDELKQFRQWGSTTPGHPERDLSKAIENTSGPLGLGHAFGIGAAIAERFLVTRFGNWMAHKTYVYISDGGIQEEISQGAGRIAGFLGLSNLIMFYDANSIQLSSRVNEVTDEDTVKKYRAWGWRVEVINGNDHAQIRSALDLALAETKAPTLIVGKTLMGKGAVDKNENPFDDRPNIHGQPLSAAGADFNKTIINLGGNPDNPFQISEELQNYYNQKLNEKRKYTEKVNADYAEWAKNNSEKAQKLSMFLNNSFEIPDFSGMQFEKPIATRVASGTVLEHLYGKIENLIVASADLSDSDKTNAFLEKTTAFSYQNFEGSFLQAGVSELTMGALSVGMALHGGVRPVCATFFVFSDYMKPVLRIAALMQTPAIFVYTHDSFRVGEDGPTHQPIEHEAQIRLLEQVQNHNHQSSMLVLRPADAYETLQAWNITLRNFNSPTALILSRQNIQILPLGNYTNGYARAAQIEKGAYIVWEKHNHQKPDIVLIANGSEVSTWVETAQLLSSKISANIRVVSVISPWLFLRQTSEYKNNVLGINTKLFGLTAGLPTVFNAIISDTNYIFGTSHFGYSAPAQVLDQKFGYIPELLEARILSLLTDKS